jgi:adenosine deaminase
MTSTTITTAGKIDSKIKNSLVQSLVEIISETNGVSLNNTLQLMATSPLKEKHFEAYQLVEEFRNWVALFQINKATMTDLLKHPVSAAFFEFFKNFPLKYREEHIHLTGSLNAEFIFPRLMKLLEGPHKALYEKKIKEVYGEDSIPIRSVADVDRLIRLHEDEGFMTYLRILYLPKLILVDRKAHEESAYHMAEELYHHFNVGKIRLKFSLSRASSNSLEQIPGADDVPPEDVVLGLYQGFKKFQDQYPDFDFVLSPSFRKEANFFDASKYKTRKDHFEAQVDEIIKMIDKYPYLAKHLNDVDTVGNEMELYRKEHFNEFQKGFRKLQYRGFSIRSHHGETFHTLKKGIQAVDNAMNIWHIDTLEHGLSLGINPNFYFHRIYQRVLNKNQNGEAIDPKDPDYKEINELDWGKNAAVREKIFLGQPLTEEEHLLFVKAKFHTAREVEHYQHDVLNRMIQKGVSLISLPSSNNKLTGQFKDYKEHPFSWWEKKGVQLGVGTDNYITLNTNFIQEMMIVLFTDPDALKITKLLMVTTGETRRPYISHLLWKMRRQMIK